MSPRFCACGGRLRYRDARRYDLPGSRWVCEECGAARTRWQAATPQEKERERDQTRRFSAKYRARIRALIEQAKDRPCVDCGGRFPTCVMDLDHVRGEKNFKVSEAVQRATALTLELVLEEIRKCEVVCANCHRIRTEAAGYNSRRGRRGGAPRAIDPRPDADGARRPRRAIPRQSAKLGGSRRRSSVVRAADS